MKIRKILLLTSIILVAALSRFFAPWPNVTPIGAIALLGGAYFQRKWLAIVIPLAALWLSNLVLNNLIYTGSSEGFIWFGESFWWVGGSMVLISAIGWTFLKKRSAGKLMTGSLASSLVFFLITNFGVWAGGMLYPLTLSGLGACYTAAIPFFWNTLAGDLFFVLTLFGVVEWSLNRFPALSIR